MAPVIDDDPLRLPATPAPAPGHDAARRHWRANLRLTAILLVAWFVVGFVLPWNARDLGFAFFGWPFGFWVAAQGGAIVFVVLIAAYAFGMRRIDRRFASPRAGAAPGETETSPTPDAPDAPADAFESRRPR